MTGTMKQNGKDDQKTDERTVYFEEAVSLTGHGKFHYLLLLVCGLCLISMIAETLSTSYLLPAAQCDFHMTSTDKGLLNAIIYVGMICSSHLWGYVADTRGRRKVLICTLIMDGLCTIVASFMPTFWLFLILRLFNGVFICGPSAVVYAYLGEFHSDKTRTSAMVWVCVFISLGVGAQPGLAWLVIPQDWSFELPWYTYHSWRVFVILCGMPALLTAVIIWLSIPESPKFLLAVGRHEEALEVLRHVYTTNTGNSSDLFPVKALKLDPSQMPTHATQKPDSVVAVIKHMWHQTKPLFLSPFLLVTLVACVIQFGLYSSSNGFLLWMPDLFNRLAEYDTIFPNNTASVCEVISSLHSMSNTDFPEESLNYTMGSISFQAIDKLTNGEFNVSGMVNSTHSISFLMNSTTMGILANTTLLGDLLSEGAVNIDVLINEMAALGLSTNGVLDSIETVTTLPICNAEVSPTAFQNTLIIGLGSSFAYIIVGYLIKYISKKTLLVTCLLSSGACGIAMFFARTYTEIVALPGFFVVLSGMCVSVVNSIVIDVFPTQLRAMALCLSLMMGRVGTVTSNVLLGLLLEVNCAFVIFGLSAIVIVCGLLSLLLPSEKKTVH